jgi:(1->4)-alpha-D-glucan 1-alpha-D-glucosylmutase
MVHPRATYRLQLRPHLDFAAARRLVPYLTRLGISHLYLSPAMEARSGSTHGYDVVDPTHLAEDLGGEEEFRLLCESGLGVILDVVPNHMAASRDENPFWRDPIWRAKFFDVEWRTGGVRRFFDISDLAGIRIEDPEVFETTHAKVIGLVRDGLVHGLRIDHPDGLANPRRYLNRLREAGVERVWVEKILEPGERLRDWPVEGTTGYEFAADVTALFVNPTSEPALTALYREFTGERREFGPIPHEAKLEQARTTFEPEVDWLAASLADVVPDADLPAALASFSVYRTYIDPDTGEVDELDREAVRLAGLPPGLAPILLLEERGHDAFVIRFQQTTPPVMGKGVEDTAFYRYNRLLCLNEVGGDPARFSLSPEQFHEGNAERLERFPRQLLATQTHDTKRSGDVRARISAISWLADDWCRLVPEWHRVTADLRSGGAPDANEEYLIYQTLLGAWPIGAGRLEGYLEKVMREEKTHTSWAAPDERWEGAATSFALALLSHRPFLDSFEPFVARARALGERIALAQTLLKLTCPGVPDVYQGDELWSLNLVDPDNRRAVDWELRDRVLAGFERGDEPRRETAKLFLIWKTLGLRARRPDAFAGSYEPFPAGERVCAFTRGGVILVAVPIAPGARFDEPSGYRDVLDGAQLGVWLLERSPVGRQLGREPGEVDGEHDRAATRAQDPLLLVDPGLDRERERAA